MVYRQADRQIDLCFPEKDKNLILRLKTLFYFLLLPSSASYSSKQLTLSTLPRLLSYSSLPCLALLCLFFCRRMPCPALPCLNLILFYAHLRLQRIEESEKSFERILEDSWKHTKSVYVQTYVAGMSVTLYFIAPPLHHE